MNVRLRYLKSDARKICCVDDLAQSAKSSTQHLLFEFRPVLTVNQLYWVSEKLCGRVPDLGCERALARSHPKSGVPPQEFPMSQLYSSSFPPRIYDKFNFS